MKTQIELFGRVFILSAIERNKVNSWGGDCYTIIVRSNGKKCQFTYTNSVANIGRDLSEKDLKLAFRCFVADAQCVEDENFKGFCGEFGYEEYNGNYTGRNRESNRIYNACRRSLESISSLTDLDLCDMLNEMSEQGIE